MPKPNRRDQILKTAITILQQDGVFALTFEAIAKRLGVTKQAVIYYFPSKPKLMEALFLPHLIAETNAAILAMEAHGDRAQIGGCFVKSIVEFHMQDLSRFRTIYLAPQLQTNPRENFGGDDQNFVAQINEATAKMYGLLANLLAKEYGLDLVQARRKAFILHTNALGFVLMQSLSAVIEDPLAHDFEHLAAVLIGHANS
jgi:AcrR family transcriptional regulator